MVPQASLAPQPSLPLKTDDPNEKRKPDPIPLYLTATERRRLEVRANAERRSLSGYVARVIAAALARQ
jgi:hypothetical protein